MNKISYLMIMGALLISSPAWAQKYANKVVKTDNIEKQIQINVDNLRCVSSSGGGTYSGSGVTHYNAAIKNLHQDEVLNSFGYSISFGSSYGCNSILDALENGQEATVHLNEELETVATDDHFDVGCQVFYRMKGTSYLRVGSETYGISSGQFYRFSPIKEYHAGVNCTDIY